MRNFVLVAALTLGALLSACGGGSGPEATVREYFRSLEASDPERLAATFLPEFGEGIEDAALPDIDIKNLTIEIISEAPDTAEVAVGYDVDFPSEVHVDVRIVLKQREGQWLISSFAPVPADA